MQGAYQTGIPASRQLLVCSERKEHPQEGCMMGKNLKHPSVIEKYNIFQEWHPQTIKNILNKASQTI